jgi:hypothetical protein
MSEAPLPPGGMRVYRASRASRRRRPRLIALVAAGVLVAAIAAGAWALARGGGDVVVRTSPTATDLAAASPSPSPTPSPTPTPPKVIEIGWIGDTTPGSKYGLPPNGGRALFASARAKLKQPDLMIANLEGTYSSAGPSKSDGNTSGTSFSFQAPPSYAKALPWAGIDLVSIANNHSYDYFERGLQQTTRALKAAGVEYAGLPDKVTFVDVRGVRVAVVGFSPYPWNASVSDIPAARRLVRRAAGDADLVVVLMHAGAEGADKIHTPRGTEIAFGENRGDSRAFAHAVIDAGADLVLGSGPHVIRGIERHKDRLIAYSLGNFGGWGNFGVGGNLSLSGLLTVKIDENGKIRGGRWLSLSINEPGVPHVDPANTSAHLVRQLSAADFARTYTLDSRGSFSVK